MNEKTVELLSDRKNTIVEGRIIQKKMYDRLNSERFRMYETDSTYLQFVRAYTGLILALNTLEKDIELEDLQKQIDEMKLQFENKGELN